MNVSLQWAAACILLIAYSCNSGYTIKPKGYYKISFPERAYQQFQKEGYPYTFEYPVYATVTQDSSLFEDNDSPYWINVDFPQFHGKIYISYKKIGAKGFEKLVEEAFKMTYTHTTKATEINDSLFQTSKGITGVWFNVGGNAATAKQFFVSDSTQHFLRGALYFDSTPNEDSLGIVNNFLQEDMKHLINSLKWK